MENSNKLLSSWILALGLFLVALPGCGDGSNDGTDDEVNEEFIEEEGAITRLNETFGVDGNLYKPVGDDHGAGAGNLVVLLSPKFSTQFDSCEIPVRSGGMATLTCINDQPWTHIPYSCFANGDRQHWRANFKCSDVAEIKVVCRSADMEVTFTAPEGQRGSICTRFG